MPTILNKKLYEDLAKKSKWASQMHFTDTMLQSELILRELKKLIKEVKKLREEVGIK
jgi:hypothetical protein